jgi:hypothetical protein
VRTGTFSNGNTLKLSVTGTTLKVFINGVQAGADATDSSISTGTFGIGYSGISSGTMLDDWDGGGTLAGVHHQWIAIIKAISF